MSYSINSVQRPLGRSVLVLLLVSISSLLHAQISLEKGYFLKENGERVECLIKNLDWKNNPTSFDYKLTDNSETLNITIDEVSQFEINGQSKYVRATVQIDRSLEDMNRLSQDRNPEFKEEVLFLKVVLEGKASLYAFNDPDVKRFFYTIDDGQITQLVYKQYRVDQSHIRENNYFRQQLKIELNCGEISNSNLERLVYREKDLLNHMISYNECVGSDYNSFDAKKTQDLFNWTIRPGLKINTIDFIENDFSSTTAYSITGGTGFRLGSEFELVLPNNRNKWALFAEPTFQYLSAEGVSDRGDVVVDYKSLEIPFGFRYYMHLGDRSKIFANAAFVTDIPLGSTLQFGRNDFDISFSANFAFGMGYKYNNKYSFEFRYSTERDILGDFVFIDAQYSSLEFILGYTL